ncbi:MAG: bifunctional nuclease family protein [Deltaproteobacteria bacterium]|nr:MAG: bifunctional nuclease family protein [Deltaproteobacteria bacterium]
MEEQLNDTVEMVVAGITLDQSNNMPIIILKALKEEVAIPIWIGLIEASAIATELEGLSMPRPMTHDLLKNVIEQLGGKLNKIVVSDLIDNTFYAILFIEQGGVMYEIDARPSDSIALALRCSAPIYVARKVLEKSQHIDMEMLRQALGESEGEQKEEKDRWTEILEKLKPEDFGKYKM